MTYSFTLPVAARFSSLFAADQVRRLTEYGSTPMAINVTVDDDIYYDVHPLALWIVCSALVFHGKRSHSLSCYHERNSCACLLCTSPSPRDQRGSRMPSSA